MNVNFLEIFFKDYQDEWGFKRIFVKIYEDENGEEFLSRTT